MSATHPTGADVVIAVPTPAGNLGAIAQGLFVGPADQDYVDAVRAAATRRALSGMRR